MMPVKQRCPKCGAQYEGSDAVGRPCPVCARQVQDQAQMVPYRDGFYPDRQILMEERIAAMLVGSGEFSEGAKQMGRNILYHVLREFRPDMFETSTTAEQVTEMVQKYRGKVLLYVVLADYTDSWADQDDDPELWTVAQSHPDLQSEFEGHAFYATRDDAERRMNQILDHATRIEEWPYEKARSYAIRPMGDVPQAPENKFQKELAALINTYSLENGSNTPDYVLAKFLEEALVAFDEAVNLRSHGLTLRG